MKVKIEGHKKRQFFLIDYFSVVEFLFVADTVVAVKQHLQFNLMYFLSSFIIMTLIKRKYNPDGIEKLIKFFKSKKVAKFARFSS